MMYCGKYAKTKAGADDSFLYVAMNMHWEPQKLAFPKLPKGMEWKLVLATEEAGNILTVQEREEQMADQTGISQDKGKSTGKSRKKKSEASEER